MKCFCLLLSLFFCFCCALPGAEGTASPEKAEVLPDSGHLISLPPERVSISTGETRRFEVPFVIERYRSNTLNARITQVEGRAFEVEGVSAGNATITVWAQGISKEYQVTVSSSLMPIYRELSRELGDLPEVSVELSDDVLTLRGEITRILRWDYFRRVVRRYEDRCRNYVTFHPGPELFEELRKQFAAAGYIVAETVSPQNPGQLKLQVSNGVLMVSGYLLSESDIVSVQRILASQKWLSPEWNGQTMRAETDLKIADIQLDVGVVFVGVTRTQLERLGNSSADGTILSWNLIAWFRALAGAAPDELAGTSGGKGLYSYLNTDLKGSLVFFGNNGVSDFRDAGHVTLTSNSKNFATYENGGTLNVKVYGQDTAELKPIEFGLKLKIRGGLVGRDEAKLELELEKSLAPIKQDEDYFQRSTKTATEIRCPLNQTAVIAGQKDLTYSDSGPGGYAFLRHIPVINWFTSSEEEQQEEMLLLILVSPKIAESNVQMTSIPSDDTKAVEEVITRSVNEKSERAREQESLNWFEKMFTW